MYGVRLILNWDLNSRLFVLSVFEPRMNANARESQSDIRVNWRLFAVKSSTAIELRPLFVTPKTVMSLSDRRTSVVLPECRLHLYSFRDTLFVSWRIASESYSADHFYQLLFVHNESLFFGVLNCPLPINSIAPAHQFVKSVLVQFFDEKQFAANLRLC